MHAQATGMISRLSLETRALFLKQADNKLVAGVLNFCISPAIANGAIDIQTGFVHGRMLLTLISTPECKHLTFSQNARHWR